MTQKKGGSLGQLDKAWRVNGTPNLALHLAILGRLVDRCMVRRLGEFGLNVAQWRAVALLSLAHRSTFRELADYAWLDRGDLSRALRKLAADGFVRRTAHPEDRRSAYLALTPKGRKVYTAFSAEWRQFEHEFNRLFSAGELRALNQNLERLAGQCLDHMAVA
ncbi:MAG: MarR family transcriptional regulator [Steroidobacteraceae bacterium]